MFSSWLQRALIAAAVSAAVAGCGAGQASTNGDPHAAPVRAVDWPYFGRVPERTQYIAEAPDPYEPMISDGRRAFLVGYQTIWAFDDCSPPTKGSQQPAGGPAAGQAPVCNRSSDAHLIDVVRALRFDRPLSSSAR